MWGKCGQSELLNPIHDPAFVRGMLADMERDKDRWGEVWRCVEMETVGCEWPVRGVLADMEPDKDRCGGGVERCGYEWIVERIRIGCLCGSCGLI